MVQSGHRSVRRRLPGWTVVEGDPLGDPQFGATQRAPERPAASRVKYDIHREVTPLAAAGTHERSSRRNRPGYGKPETMRGTSAMRIPLKALDISQIRPARNRRATVAAHKPQSNPEPADRRVAVAHRPEAADNPERLARHTGKCQPVLLGCVV